MIKLKNILREAGLVKEQATKQLGDTQNVTFPSGKWKMSTELKTQLDQILTNIQSLIQSGGKVTSITVEASESKVPNYDGETPDPSQNPLAPGDLSKNRLTTILQYLNNSDVIKSNNIKVQPLNKGAQGPDWVQGANKDDQKYTDVQYVRVAAFGEKKVESVPVDFSQYTRIHDVMGLANTLKYSSPGFLVQILNKGSNINIGTIDASDKFKSEVPNPGALKPVTVGPNKVDITKKTMPYLIQAFGVKTPEEVFIKLGAKQN